jgi:hypothetical protein
LDQEAELQPHHRKPASDQEANLEADQEANLEADQEANQGEAETFSLELAVQAKSDELRLHQLLQLVQRA